MRNAKSVCERSELIGEIACAPNWLENEMMLLECLANGGTQKWQKRGQRDDILVSFHDQNVTCVYEIV